MAQPVNSSNVRCINFPLIQTHSLVSQVISIKEDRDTIVCCNVSSIEKQSSGQ